MVDFSKCDGSGCPQKKECYRYAKPGGSIYQIWIDAKSCIDDDFSLFYPWEILTEFKKN